MKQTVLDALEELTVVRMIACDGPMAKLQDSSLPSAVSTQASNFDQTLHLFYHEVNLAAWRLGLPDIHPSEELVARVLDRVRNRVGSGENPKPKTEGGQ